MATRIWRMCTCDGTRNGIQFVEIDADLLRPNRLPPTQRGESNEREKEWVLGKGRGGERSGRREKDITTAESAPNSKPLSSVMLCVLCFFIIICNTVCEENIYDSKVWNLLLELVCVKKMVEHKKNDIITLGNQPTHYTLELPWHGPLECQEQ
jgi:hypothetical protein